MYQFACQLRNLGDFEGVTLVFSVVFCYNRLMNYANDFFVTASGTFDKAKLSLNTVLYDAFHFHEELEINFVLDGDMTARTGKGEFSARKGDFVIFNHDMPHEIETFGKGVTLISVLIPKSVFNGVLKDGESVSFNKTVISDAFDFYDDLRYLLLSLMKASILREKYYKFQTNALFSDFLYLLLTSAKHTVVKDGTRVDRNARLKRLIEFVENGYADKLRLQDFADNEGISLFYASHFVKDALNSTFQDYVTRIRLNNAVKLLLTAKKTVSDISVESGFSDMRYLYKAFDGAYSLSPKELKKKLSEKDEAGVKTEITERYIKKLYTDEKVIELIKAYETEEGL